MTIEFPITVNSVTFDHDPYRSETFSGRNCGDFVAVRPCEPEYDNKTFLGVLIGEIPLHVGVVFDPEVGKLKVFSGMHNPMIYIPDLKRVVFGAGSFWAPIKDENHLRKITNDDISNIWYVQAMNALASASAATKEKEE